ncbi:MAG: PD40 domain-containing protein, partial [Candidatus Aminicenantes bacterium]|nr:PD40 domain-containing protein [Candidatus Aminicenantes bacterium]
TGGVTEALKRRIILPLGPSLGASDHVIGHELVHAFQYDITSFGHSPTGYTSAAIHRIPLWMVEGMAEYLSIGPKDALTSMWMRDASYRNELPTIKKMDDPRYFPYRYGHAFWAYVTGKYGDQAVSRIMKAVGKAGDYQVAIEKVLGVSVDDLSKDWQESLKSKYDPLSKETKIKDDKSRILFQGTRQSVYNVGPSISPDGKKIVFLSTRDLFAVDMFLADVETKKVERKLINMALSAHFESLQFIISSGSWDSAGKRFAFAAISSGQPILTIIDVTTGNTEKEIRFAELGEIFNPTWSPDGRHIAFSAVVGGFSDLFIYDLQEEKLRRMTEDPYSQLQPAWSPDGRWIAFVTEQFTTDLAVLDIGNFELALMDPNTGEVSRLPGFANAKNINPQWAPDSENIVFISDSNGIADLYNLNLKTEELRQLSNLYTGVSGITDTSPALSVAQKSGRIAYSYYEGDYYSLYTKDFDQEEGLGTHPANFDPIQPEVLPPRDIADGDLQGLLRNPIFGLPDESAFPTENYKAKLKLDYISPPTMAIGVDRFGTYGGGGLAMFFSDMLGYHSLSTMFSINTRLQDSSALIGYQNNRSRLTWGGALQRVSYPYRYYFQYIDEVNGEGALVEQELIFRQIYYQALGFMNYPLSQVTRLELSGGYRIIDFDQEARTRAFSLIDGREILFEKEKLPSADSLYMPYFSTAFVHDNSFFGATAPILGQSAIFQIQPMFGTLKFTSILTDVRKYFMPVRPFTLAFRLLHTGRYGTGGEDGRLYPLFMGYESLIRGYSYYSFSSEELSNAEGIDVYNRLFGSRMAIFNAELRFPLFGALGLGRGFYGILPIDFLAFFDGGVAWDSSNKPSFLGGDRDPLMSAGIGLRMNLFGYMIVGVNYVYPFQRPERGAYFELSFYPGF